MTKTLTEQWRDGTLQKGYYYTKVINILEKERIMIDYYIPELHHFEIMPSEYVKEVIVEAPSYDEYNELVSKTEQLEKRLEIATKALEEYMTFCRHPAEEALKEMEGVK